MIRLNSMAVHPGPLPFARLHFVPARSRRSSERRRKGRGSRTVRCVWQVWACSALAPFDQDAPREASDLANSEGDFSLSPQRGEGRGEG